MIADDKGWKPTERIIRGIVKKPYLPLDRHPELARYDDHFFNLYCGDELYLFEETRDGKWVRGYFRWNPLPEAYISGMSAVDAKFPHLRSKLVIIPRKYVEINAKAKILGKRFLKLPDPADFEQNIGDDCVSRSIYRSLDHNASQADEINSLTKPPRPSFPYFRYQEKPLVEDLGPVLVLLSSHIYSMYSAGEFVICEKLSNLFYELESVRMRMLFNLMTSSESVTITRTISCLLTNMSKLMSAKGQTDQFNNSSDRLTCDPAGIEAVFGRNITTGELLTYNETNLQSLTCNTMLHGLYKDFPKAGANFLQTDLPKNDLFENSQSHILVDVHNVTSDTRIGNPKLHNISASMFLCSASERLTEPFTVNMNSKKNSSLNSISAALFKNICNSQIQRSNIYLAIILTEKVPISTAGTDSFHAPFIPLASSDEDSLTHIRKGIAAGAVDITRVFKKFNESNADLSIAFKFKISLFSSFSNRSAHRQSNRNDIWPTGNQGWGDLIDRIIKNSCNGVAINPRATSIFATVKEIRGTALENTLKTSVAAIKSVSTYFYDIHSEPSERVYLSLGRVSLVDERSTNVRKISIKIASRNKMVKFGRTSGEDALDTWDFVSVRPGVQIGGVVRIQGLEYMEENEPLRVLAYINGLLMAKAYIYIKKEGRIMTYKKFTPFQLVNSLHEPLLTLEVASDYMGKAFNVDESLQAFLDIPSFHRNGGLKFIPRCSHILSKLGDLSFGELHKHFKEILHTYLELFQLFGVKESDEFPNELKHKTFVCFVDFIDKLLVKNHRFRSSFYKYYEKYLYEPNDIPDVGATILRHMSGIFSTSYKAWDKFGSRAARSSTYLLMISVLASQKSKVEWRSSFQLFFSQVCQFLANTDNSVTRDQITILQLFGLWLEPITVNYEPEALVQFCLGLLQGCHSKEENLDFKSKKLSTIEERYSATKLGLIRQILVNNSLREYLFKSGTDQMMRSAFISKCIHWALIPYTAENLNISLLRMGNGILITIFDNATDKKLQRNLIRLQPTLCRAFILTRKFCKENSLFKPKITFTKLFPFTTPHPVIPMDSLIGAEVVVEVLLEVATIICEIAKIVEMEYGMEASFKEILLESQRDIEFQTEFCSKQISSSNVSTLYHTVKLLSRGDFFPSKKWIGVSAMYNRSSLTLLSMYKDYMIKENTSLASEKADVKLWSTYMKGIFTIANHKVSFLIKLGVIPRKAVYRISGNLKSQAAHLLSDGWNALAGPENDESYAEKFGIKKFGPTQLRLLEENPSLIQEIFIFALHKHLDSQRSSCEMLWSAIMNYWKTYGNLQPFLDATIPELYNAYQSGRVYITDYEIRRLRLCMLYAFHAPSNDESYIPIVTMIEETFGFLKTVSNAFKISDEEEFDDDRTAVHMEMFGYLLDANRPELFHKMVYDLFLHFIKKKDHVQAALCLELLANTYKWNPNDSLPPIPYPPLPEQSSFERKEYLYKESARNFAKGLKLEKALSIYKDLIAAYDHINYDLNGLAYVHGEISNLYTNLQTLDRFVPTYFKVSFTGFGFPKSLRNKKFIFEGLPFEHITSMHNRLLKIYHGTTIIQNQERIDELYMKPSMGRFIYVTTVEPRFEISDEYKQNADKRSKMDNKIWMYIENRNLRTFCKSRRLPGTTNVTDLWVDEYTFETASTFPTLMNRSEIIEISTRKLSPLENALRSLQLKIQELNGLENMCWKAIKEHGDYSEIFNELSRNLTGTIDAPVNGGMTQYRDFLKPPMVSKLEESSLNMLKTAFSDLAVMISRCLVLHREILPSDGLLESHKMLIKLFEKNFAPEIQKNNINMDSLTASSLTKTSSSQHSSSIYPRSQFQRSIHQNVTKLDRLDRAPTTSIHSRDSTPSRADIHTHHGNIYRQSSSAQTMNTTNTTATTHLENSLTPGSSASRISNKAITPEFK